MKAGEKVLEDDMDVEAVAFNDDNDVPINILVDFVISGKLEESIKVQEGCLKSTVAVEEVDYKDKKLSWAEEVNIGEGICHAPGKRKVTANRIHTGNHFWAH